MHLQRPPARSARTHPRHSLRSPAGAGCHPIPSSGLPPFCSRDGSALGQPDSHWGPEVVETPSLGPSALDSKAWAFLLSSHIHECLSTKAFIVSQKDTIAGYSNNKS